MAKKLEVTIVGDASNVKRAFNDATSSSKNFGSAIGTVAKIGAAAAVGGIAAVGVGLFKSVQAAQEAEVSQRRMATALEALGTSYDAHAKQIDTVIQKQSQLAALDDEDLQDSFTKLARVVGGDVNKALNLNAIAADVARGKGIELEAATAIVTKAALGNVGALKRQGIEIPKVTAAQDALKEAHGKVTEAQTKAAKAADDAATRQSAIAALQKTFAGAAADYGNSSAAAGEKAAVAFENLQEKIGAFLLPTVAGLADSLSDAVDWVSKLVDKISSAPTLKLKFEVVKDAISDLLFGSSKKELVVDQDTMIVKVRTVQTPGVVDKIKESIKKESDQINWDDVGQSISKRIGQSLRDTPRELATALPAFRAFGQLMERELNQIGGRFQDWWHGLIRQLPGVMAGLGREIAGNVVEAVSSAAAAGGRVAVTIGKQIIAGALRGLVALPITLLFELGKIAAAISATASNAYSWAVGIGEAVVSGVIGGLGSLVGRVGSAIAGKVRSAIDWAKNNVGSTAEEYTAKQIGEPAGRGVLLGFILGTQDLPTKMKDKIKNAIDHARQAVDEARSLFSTSFSRLAGDALSAFDAETDRLAGIIDRKLAATIATIDAHVKAATAKWDAQLQGIQAGAAAFGAEQTESEAEISRIQRAREETGLVEAQTAATKALNEAKAKGDADAIASAERQLAIANENLALHALQIKAAEERRAKEELIAEILKQNEARIEKAKGKVAAGGERDTATAEGRAGKQTQELEADRALMRRHFEDQLAELEAMFTKSGATSAGKFKKAAVDTFGEYGVSFAEAGRDLGKSFGQGLIEAMTAAAEAAAKILADALGAASSTASGPGKTGDMSKSTMSPMLAAPSPAGNTVNVYNAGSVTSENDLVASIRAGLLKTQNSGTSLGFT